MNDLGDVSSVIERSKNEFARSWPRNIELERHERVLMVEKAEACAVLTLWTTAHPTSWDSGASQAEVSGSYDGNAHHSSVDVATHLRIRLLPLRSE
jgi:hypothetical protein